MQTSGSSPRMRGKRSRRRCPTSSPRIIPAHAGQTSCRNCGTHNHPDHPRACGANTIAFGEFFVGSGSSPRMRGKQTGSPDLADSVRIIPAHAGQTRPQVPALGAITDHPRACGANKYPMICHAGRFGSSPRMRGKPGALNVPHSSSRIIPAHAGQTLRCCCRRCDIPDHPRACGANNPDCDRVVQDAGSSPRMRGKHFHEVRVFDLGRIIPAHAGQTGFWVNTSMSPPDHPRACGANR